jgi:hypothetical protein
MTDAWQYFNFSISSARLHLHQQSWFPNDTYEYETCSFKSHAVAKTTSNDDGHQMQQSGSMRSSIGQIVNVCFFGKSDDVEMN